MKGCVVSVPREVSHVPVVSLKNRSDAVMIITEPTRICAGNHRTDGSGMSMARMETAPAGGMNMACAFIRRTTVSMVSAAARYNGKTVKRIQRVYRKAAPISALVPIRRTAFTGFFLAPEDDFENSVNATRRGGATANRISSANAV